MSDLVDVDTAEEAYTAQARYILENDPDEVGLEALVVALYVRTRLTEDTLNSILSYVAQINGQVAPMMESIKSNPMLSALLGG
jgi:hypothetical protein